MIAIQLVLAALVLFFAACVKAGATNGLSAAEIQGRQLAQQLCAAQPSGNLTNSGTLQIRNDASTNVFIKCLIIATPDQWQNIYEAVWTNISAGDSPCRVTEKLTIHHFAGQSVQYQYEESRDSSIARSNKSQATTGKASLENSTRIVSTISELKGDELFKPFAGSDFWICDLGMEFLHWPEQKVLPKKTNLKRGRAYTLLESTHPHPGTNGYSRVVSWIDQETGGILEAEAYDSHGKVLKDFEPKSFKKVNGQWELQEMQIENVQTGARTRLEFDLKK